MGTPLLALAIAVAAVGGHQTGPASMVIAAPIEKNAPTQRTELTDKTFTSTSTITNNCYKNNKFLLIPPKNWGKKQPITAEHNNLYIPLPINSYSSINFDLTQGDLSNVSDTISDTSNQEDNNKFNFEWTTITVSSLVCILVLAIWVWGHKANEKLVHKWIHAVKPILETDFVLKNNNEPSIHTVSWHEYEVFCTGRPGLHYLMIAMHLLPRQCLWRFLIMKLLMGKRDAIVVTAAFDKTLPSVCFLTKRRDHRNVQQDLKDVGDLAHLRQSAENFAEFSLWSEDMELPRILTNGKPGTKLEQCKNKLISLRISDRISDDRFVVTGCRVIFEFEAPKTDQEMQRCIDCALVTCNTIQNFQISPKATKLAQVSRESLEHAIISERTQDKVENMTPEQLEKHRLKQQKKQKKSLQPRFKVLRA